MVVGPYRGLGGVGVGQWGGQPLKVRPAGPHPGEGVGALDQGVAAPGGSQDAARLWNVRVPYGRTDGGTDGRDRVRVRPLESGTVATASGKPVA